MELEYKPFQKYILRTPLKSINCLNKTNYVLADFIKETEFLQGVRLSSPSLYKKIINWESVKINDNKEYEKLIISTLKYYTRACSRCTPYGLFAGVSVGKILDKTCIIRNKTSDNITVTRLDLDLLFLFIHYLISLPVIRNSILFFTNNTTYKLFNSIRYIEYKFVNSKKLFKISEIESNKYINKVLKIAKNGSMLYDLIEAIKDYGFSHEDAEEFINQLINSQLLVAELELNITGNEPHIELFKRLNSINLGQNTFLENLETIYKELSKIDQMPVGCAVSIFDEIEHAIKLMNPSFNVKYFFQSNLTINTTQNTVSEKVLESIKDGLIVLNKLTQKNTNTNLQKFKDEFINRYEYSEVPLALVLDPENGIGYLQDDKNNYTFSPLIDDLIVSKEYKASHVSFDKTQSYLLHKLTTALKENSEIEIKLSELTSFKESWDDLPITFSVVINIVMVNGEEYFVMKSVGGSSATNLISRFAHGNNEINELLYEIIDRENQHEKNLVSAEIVHLPETRTGNILLRPHVRKYEIPILTNSTLNFANQLPFDDLMISIQNNRIILRSKKLKKRIIPYLSNAHNYSNKSLPAYHLLADLQNQDLRNALFLNWGFLKAQFDYFPRVTYGKIIVSLAFWQIYQDELKLIINNKSFEMNEYLKLITKRGIPRDVLLVEGDNELYINNENSESVKMLLSIVKNKPFFILKEFLFADTNQLVLDTDGNPYTNEFIFSFYKN